MSQATTQRVRDAGLKRFIAKLVLSGLLVAFGFSIALFGLTSKYLVTTFDQVATIATGVGLMALGGIVAYLTLD